jgi:hypothetical protein
MPKNNNSPHKEYIEFINIGTGTVYHRFQINEKDALKDDTNKDEGQSLKEVMIRLKSLFKKDHTSK